jgi:hypothetical protein
MLKYVNAVDNTGNAPIFDPTTTKHTHAMNAIITELTEQQIETIVSKLPLPIITEEQERYIMDDFADGHKWMMRGLITGEYTTARCKRQYKEYRKYRLESMRWSNWMQDHSCKMDYNRGKYVAHL